MTPKIRVVGLDLDGTVLNSQKQLTPRTAAAIRRALDAGCAVLPATGRTRGGLPEELTAIPGVRWAVLANGAVVLDLATGQPILSHPLAREDALAAFPLLAEYDMMLDVYQEGKAFTSAAAFARVEQFAPPAMLAYFRATRTVVDDLPAWLAAQTAPVEKLTMLFTDLQQRRQAWDKLVQAGRWAVTSSIPNNIELNAVGVDKGMALLALAERLGFGKEQVMACGDSSNDLAMLRAVGLPVAMGNAGEEVKALAKAVTGTNDEDGVAQALERYVLGE